MLAIHIISIILATVSSMVLGMLWYSDLMFGKKWRHLMGISCEDMEKGKNKKMTGIFAQSFLFTLGQAFIVYILFVSGFELLGIFAIWIGFSLPIFANSVLWEGKPWKLFSINATYSLASLALTFEVFRIFFGFVF